MNKKILVITLGALCAGSLLNAATKVGSVNIINGTDDNISGKVTFAVQTTDKDGKMTYSDKVTKSFDFTDEKKKSMRIKADNENQRLHTFMVKREKGKLQTVEVLEYGQKALSRTIKVLDDEIKVGHKKFKLNNNKTSGHSRSKY
jgi:uncharacterized cupredoxin-like copper-binding protein